MSRRRGEFEHRTSIFEGAFRAWSHLGGLEPDDLEAKPMDALEPLSNPIAPADDARVRGGGADAAEAAAAAGRRLYPYEPLPRSGLAHPFVQAILSPWLGPDADQDAIALGLTTLRTWWQHRRKGESGSAIAALSTEKMQGVVDGYTKHFFALAYCLVVKDKEQPPRSLHTKYKVRDKSKRRAAGATEGLSELERSRKGDLLLDRHADLLGTDLTPLERLHVAQQQQLKQMEHFPGLAAVPLKGQCLPGLLDLAGVTDAVNRQASQLAHRGAELPSAVSSGGPANGHLAPQPPDLSVYGDVNSTPIVFCSTQGDCAIAMSVEGITCAHCVKIVETVLKGCNGNRSPIVGVLDAVAVDRCINSVLVKIDRPASAKRIAFEAARNLAMVGYTAKALEISILDDNKRRYSLGAYCQAFEATARSTAADAFDWGISCSCPDNGIQRQDCPRHTQIDAKVLERFQMRGAEVTSYLKENAATLPQDDSRDLFGAYQDPSLVVGQPMNGMEPDGATYTESFPMAATGAATVPSSVNLTLDKEMMPRLSFTRMSFTRRASRNPSILSYGNGLQHASITSETTFGRAMSGLSALSIDWENLDDFDLEVDHSAHINNQSRPGTVEGRSDLRHTDSSVLYKR